MSRRLDAALLARALFGRAPATVAASALAVAGLGSILALTDGPSFSSRARADAKPKVGDTAPAFATKQDDGKTFELSSRKGKGDRKSVV